MSVGRILAMPLTLAAVGLGCQSQNAVHVSGSQDPLPVLWDPTTDAPTADGSTLAAVSTSAHNLAVLTFNMQHRDRPAELAAMARYLGDVEGIPDFILCQEVLFKRTKWQGFDNTAAVLADELGCYVEGTNRRGNREGVAIVSRHPFVFYDERHLKARTSSLWMGFPRVSVLGEFIVPGVGRVRVVSTHLAYQPWEGHIRRKQLNETLAWMAEREALRPAVVTIFGGDFNLRPGAPEFAPLADPRITGRLRFMDSNTDRPTLRGFGGKPVKRVDYIFVSAPGADVRFLGERLLFPDGLWHTDGSSRFHPSDHLPVLHEYAMSGQSIAAGATVSSAPYGPPGRHSLSYDPPDSSGGSDR